MDSETLLAWSVVLATFAGPILAVFVTRSVDDLRSKKAKKLDIFRVLIRTRRTQLNPDFVAALNMVEIDFYKAPKVLAVHAELMRHLATGPVNIAWVDRTNRLVARLLTSMGQNLGYAMEQLDILEGGYIPQAMVDDEDEQQKLRRALLKVFDGERAIPVTLSTSVQNLGQVNPSSIDPLMHDVPPPAK